jgi:hypothetical protein
MVLSFVYLVWVCESIELPFKAVFMAAIQFGDYCAIILPFPPAVHHANAGWR